MYFLEIIIPQYKESEKIVSNLLNSIGRQKKVNFDDIKITIINDASDVLLDNKFLNSYKNLNIEYKRNEKNLGQSLTEQRGIDESKAKYVMFVDSDDELYSDNSLAPIISILKESKPNILCASMLQENMVNDQLISTPVSFNQLRTLHGVFIKRKYLIENDIRFSTKLRYYEDTYMVTILASRNNYKVINNIVYVWKYNDQSKTLAKNKYDVSVRHFIDMLNSYKGVYEYFCKYNINNKEIYFAQQIVELSLIVTSSYFDFPELKEEQEKYEKLVYEWYLDNKGVIEKIGNIMFDKIIKYQTKDLLSYYKNIKLNMDFYGFINMMENKK